MGKNGGRGKWEEKKGVGKNTYTYKTALWKTTGKAKKKSKITAQGACFCLTGWA